MNLSGTWNEFSRTNYRYYGTASLTFKATPTTPARANPARPTPAPATPAAPVNNNGDLSGQTYLIIKLNDSENSCDSASVNRLQCNGMHCKHESDCTKFYQIVHCKPVEMPCAPGTRFNLAIGVCDWPHNVECSAGFKPEPPKEIGKSNGYFAYHIV